jgi:hypothetical protein
MSFNEALRKVLAGEGGDDCQARFAAKAAEIAERDGVPEHEAMRIARAEHPSVFDALQASAASPLPHRGAGDPDARKRAQASAAFEAKAQEIATRDSLPFYAAMSLTRREHPELFLALQ